MKCDSSILYDVDVEANVIWSRKHKSAHYNNQQHKKIETYIVYVTKFRHR